MTRTLTLTMCVLAVFLSVAFASAQEADVEGSKDHPLISRYPGSLITEYKQEDFDEFELPLGRLKDGKGEKSQHLEGKITRLAERRIVDTSASSAQNLDYLTESVNTSRLLVTDRLDLDHFRFADHQGVIE